MMISEEKINRYLQLAKHAALQARPILLESFGHIKNVQEKDQAGLVSAADLESERVITEYLKKHSPECDLLGEEAAYHNPDHLEALKKPTGQLRWVIDPLDGTTNYVHGFSIFCISIGLELDGKPLLGVIDAPVLNQTFWASQGRGAWMNDRPIFVSQRSELSQSLVATGFFTSNQAALRDQLQLFNKVVAHVRGVRRAGAAAYDLCMVASGVFDAFWEKNLSPWDTCAGAILVTEAGGQVTQFNGEPYTPYQDSVLATNGLIHGPISKILFAV